MRLASTRASRTYSLACFECGREYGLAEPRWRCDCGSILTARISVASVRWKPGQSADPSWWRFRDALPPLRDEHPVTLGDPVSPLLEITGGRPCLLAKLDFLSPTGSFKDRNASLIATRLASWGIEDCAVDSSGNAGVACAAYCARAGIHCTVYVPAYTTVAKRRLIEDYGARVELIDGPRHEATRAALERSEDTFYGGQTHSPFFLLGGVIWALELFDKLGRLPDTIILPVGSGSLLLGAAYGFELLTQSGCASTRPRLFATQAKTCAPLVHAFEQGLDCVDTEHEWGNTIAEGIATARPLRSRQLLEAVRNSGGSCIVVTDEAIEHARRDLAHRGLCVEPTGAVAFAGFRSLQTAGELDSGETVVISLTGSGQKYVASAQ